MKKIKLNTEQFNELNRFSLVRSGLDSAWYELNNICDFVPSEDIQKLMEAMRLVNELMKNNFNKFNSNVKYIADE